MSQTDKDFYQESQYLELEELDDGDYETNVPGECWGKFIKGFKENLFMILILLGVAAGFGLGFLLRAVTSSKIVTQWIELVGTLYIRILDMTILPLIASNLIVVVASINPKEQGKSSIIAFFYIIGTNLFGASIGTALSAIIKPGVGVAESGNDDEPTDPKLQPSPSDVIADLVRNLFPDNIVGMCIQQSKTVKVYETTANVTEIKSKLENNPSKNLIGILVVSIMFGLAARGSREKGKIFLDFFTSIRDVVIKIVRAVLLLTPVGVCFMIAGAVMNVKDISGTFSKIGMFIVTVTLGIAILFIAILLLYFACTFKNPFKFLKHTIRAWFISFATTSPVVALPEMFQGCDNFGIPESISRCVCPIMAALKADGPAIFISCACMFTIQLSIGTVPVSTALVIWILTSISVLAIPHIPNASIAITIIILNSANVPVKDTSYLYAIDWLLDRFRSGITTITSMYGAAIIHGVVELRSSKKKFNNWENASQ